MSLDTQAEHWLTQLANSGAPPLHQMSVSEARAALAQLVAEHGPHRDSSAQITDDNIPGPADRIPIRIYTPSGSRPHPALVYFHGGGFVLGDLDTSDGACSVLAARAHAVVISVDYRLAPEHPFPAAVEDAWAATRWVAEHAAELGVSVDRIAVGGDSAGANLAAVVALLARDADGPALTSQLLLYPITDAGAYSASYEANAEGYFLTKDTMRWFLQHYLPDEADRADWRASPGRAPDLTGLPPALVVTAEYDPVRGEAEAYATRLRQAGCQVTSTRYPGQIHGFAASLAGAMDDGHHALREAGTHLRQTFRGGWQPRLWLVQPQP